ncbi:hypothetical protein AXG93_1233s1000 [Marchantia polymorpha subsp. ruderalis]|uniref:Uncharacterized protein n=1 Tax=Marchantia polymorpha subsp. ruderalis TaxID=1480154 RepID=A0A176VIB0_MARPO|nr:hypothetical protein AXG93_1233s1000 [Marchantia polymorpha subsp. ruderalis]
MGSEEVPQPKSSEEMKRDLTLSEERLEQVVAQDIVVPLLKYLDGKKGKYAISKETGFYVEMIRKREQKRQRRHTNSCEMRRPTVCM